MNKTPKTLFSNLIFYDAHCKFCLNCIRFALKRKKKAFPCCFSPIGGKTFCALQKIQQWKSLPNSLILYHTDTHQLAIKGEAAILLIKKLRFPWNILAHLLSLLPAKFLNFLYDTIARNRYKLCKNPNWQSNNKEKSNQNILIVNNPGWKKYFRD